MVGGLPFGLEVARAVTIGVNAGLSGQTIITPNATANTKGAWTTLTAATTVDASMVYYSCGSGEAQANGPYLIDFAIGPAGSEKPIIQNIPIGYAGATIRHTDGMLPLHIARGQRVSARCQAAVASGLAIMAGMTLFEGSLSHVEGAAGCDGIGANTGTSLGTQMTSGGSVNTKGSYAQLIAATTRDYMGFIVHLARNNLPALSLSNELIDIAVGPAGSERIILADLFSCAYDQTSNFPDSLGPFYIPIAAGTRIAARHQCDTASTQQNIVLVAFYA